MPLQLAAQSAEGSAAVSDLAQRLISLRG